MRQSVVDLRGGKILELLNDHSGMSWDELVDFVYNISELDEDDPRFRESVDDSPEMKERTRFAKRRESNFNMAIYNCLMELLDAGLIIIDGIQQEKQRDFLYYCLGGSKRYGYKIRPNKIRSSDAWRKIRRAIELDYFDSKHYRQEPMTVYPFFGVPNFVPDKPDLFVAMPFKKELQHIYTDNICGVAERIGLKVARADNFFTANSIMSDIWSAINAAKIVLADCTGKNPNVFYEMGIAHTVGKPLILISQNDDDVPFDLRHVRYIMYNCTPEGLLKLNFDMSNALGYFKITSRI